ncbi:MAG TPA: hypothetical protein VHV51_15150 [Polyangiaceae bacterium]|nr:hypothetical protein [Polyangiaceae bacterium]
MRVRNFLSLFGLALLACGGRTLDDGVYDADSAGNISSCSYRGTIYEDGSFIGGVCACFCDRGQIACEEGCSSPSGGTSSGGGGASSIGAVGGGTTISGGASSSGGSAPAAGASSGGSSSAFGGSTGIGGSGSAFGGSAGIGGGPIGTGGAAGTAGAPPLVCGLPTRATGTTALIDNMEDGDPFIGYQDGRSGIWYTYNDSTPGAVQLPSIAQFTMTAGPDATGGKHYANTYGKGFLNWGAGMGFGLNSGCPYDGSIYEGVHFWIRAEFGIKALFVMVPTAATTPADNGGTCLGPAPCYDDYQTQIVVNSNWTEEYIPFSALTQQGWGQPAAFDPRTLMGMNFQTLQGEGESFSFSVDSVSFYAEIAFP